MYFRTPQNPRNQLDLCLIFVHHYDGNWSLYIWVFYPVINIEQQLCILFGKKLHSLVLFYTIIELKTPTVSCNKYVKSKIWHTEKSYDRETRYWCERTIFIVVEFF